MIVPFAKEPDAVNFGDLPPRINALLQQGVAAYRTDFDSAEKLFREALEVAPEELPTYLCLYKIHTYHGNLDEARLVAERGLKVAAAQAGLPPDWRLWRPQPGLLEGPARFALYTLKALAFIHLRRDEKQASLYILDVLAEIDPSGAVGWPVIADLAAGVA